MAICPDCHLDVADATSCTRRHFTLGKAPVPRIPYGQERRAPTEYSYNDRCDDCGVDTGGYHHRDCAVEQCPLCGDYAAVCRCWSFAR